MERLDHTQGGRTMNYIGLDIHKKNTQACMKNEDGKVMLAGRFPSRAKDLNAFIDKVEEAGGPASFVIESTGFCIPIYDIIASRGHEIKVAHPLKVKALTSGRAKTDKNDAEMLAELLRLKAIPASYIPPAELRQLRELTRFRQILVRNTTSIKNEIHAFLAYRGVETPTEYRSPFTVKHQEWLRSLHLGQVDDLLDIFVTLRTKIEKVEGDIERASQKKDEVALLKTIPGVGDVIANELMAEICDITRFSSAENLYSYAGMVSSVHQSGEKGWTGPITKQGNASIRHIMVEAAFSHIRCCRDSKLTLFYERKKEQKGTKKAIVAMARKMLGVVYRMLKEKEEFHAH
ncbi:MAG: IS110 family transposase [Methanomassiliicoccales archaeon]